MDRIGHCVSFPLPPPCLHGWEWSLPCPACTGSSADVRGPGQPFPSAHPTAQLLQSALWQAQHFKVLYGNCESNDWYIMHCVGECAAHDCTINNQTRLKNGDKVLWTPTSPILIQSCHFWSTKWFDQLTATMGRYKQILDSDVSGNIKGLFKHVIT